MGEMRHIGIGIDLGEPFTEIYMTSQKEDVDRMSRLGFKIIHAPGNEQFNGSIFEDLWVLVKRQIRNSCDPPDTQVRLLQKANLIE